MITKVNPSILNYPNVSQSEKIEFRKLALKNLSNQSILSESSNMAKNFDDVSQM